MKYQLPEPALKLPAGVPFTGQYSDKHKLVSFFNKNQMQAAYQAGIDSVKYEGELPPLPAYECGPHTGHAAIRTDESIQAYARQAIAGALQSQAERIRELEAEASATKQQAQIWKMEASTQKATVQGIYQLCTGGTGEPGDWNGANPVRKLIAERDTLRAQLDATGLGEALEAIIAKHLVGLYVCTRVWEAWNVGTMSESDFIEAGETEFAQDLAGDIVEALSNFKGAK